MDTFLNMQDELTFQLMSATNSTLYTTDRKKTEIKEAYTWAASLFVWNETLKAKVTDSGVSQEYYDYPSEFRTGTVVMLEYNGEEYDRKNWEDYQDYKRNNPNSTKKIFSNFGRQYFIFPKPSAAVSQGITVWGAIQPTQLSADADKTIFSLSNPEGNGAIVKKALSVLIKAKDKARAKDEENEATAILTRLYKLQLDSQQRDQRIEHPKFDVPDYFSQGYSSSRQGRFSVDLTGE